jgi:hypothetical protein
MCSTNLFVFYKKCKVICMLVILISVIYISIYFLTVLVWSILGYWTRAIKRFALFDLLKSLYSDINILSKYIPSRKQIDSLNTYSHELKHFGLLKTYILRNLSFLFLETHILKQLTLLKSKISTKCCLL